MPYLILSVAFIQSFPSSPSGCVFSDDSMVRGKILLCRNYDDGAIPLPAGAKGMVLLFDSNFSVTYPLPAISVDTRKAEMLINYVNKTR